MCASDSIPRETALPIDLKGWLHPQPIPSEGHVVTALWRFRRPAAKWSHVVIGRLPQHFESGASFRAQVARLARPVR
jgi:hypothetical protein